MLIQQDHNLKVVQDQEGRYSEAREHGRRLKQEHAEARAGYHKVAEELMDKILGGGSRSVPFHTYHCAQ